MILTKLPRGRFANLAYGDDEFIGPPEYEDWAAEHGGTTGSNNGWDGDTISGLVSSLVGSLSSMFGSIFSGAGNKNQTTGTISGAGQTYIPVAQKSSNNAWIWILLAVIVVVIVLLVLKKRKK